MQSKSNIATDSFILIFVQVITMSVSIINAMILSRTLSVYDYGTYSQGLIVISMTIPFVALGMNQGINYFFNKSETQLERGKYINTIFGLTILTGIIAGIVIIILNGQISGYFKNDALSNLMAYIAFRPLVSNLIALYQPLYISSGMAKAIAFRNLIISMIQIGIISGISLLTQNIALIFILLLTMDIGQLFILGFYIRKFDVKINPFKIERFCIKPILIYCIPMALATLMGTLTINMDKLLIGAMMTTEDLAIYTNASKELPFGFIVSSLTTVVMPIVIRITHSSKRSLLAKIWGDYVEIGYITTWIIGAMAIVCSKELFEFLYGTKYAMGLSVFNIYLLVSMIRFTYFGMILTTTGKTKWILIYSVVTLFLNFLLNWLFYKYFGMIGPALASLISIGAINFLQMFHSARIVNLKMIEVLRLKKMFFLLLQLLIVGVVVFLIKTNILVELNLNNFVILVLCAVFFLGVMGILQYKNIEKLIFDLNHI